MKRLPLLLSFCPIACLAVALAEPQCRVDSLGRFEVTTEFPAGTRHASLEYTDDLSSGSWRKMMASPTGTRAGRVTFRLPRSSERGFARVVVSTDDDLPDTELDDSDLVTVRYGAPIAEGMKIAFLQEAAVQMRGASELSPAEYVDQLVEWAEGMPEIDSAELSPVAGDITVRFKDGDFCVLMNDARGYDAPQRLAPLAEGVPTPAAGRRGKSVAVGSLPGTRRAITAFSLESTFPNSAPTLCGWLQSRGYDSTDFPSTTVQQVMQWSGPGNPLGVLFWHAHGCSYKKEDGSEGIGIITRELTGITHPVYGEMRESGELMLAIDKNQELPYYGITSKFIRSRMRFAPHSVVMIDACCGGHPDLGEAFLAAGVGTYVSWDWLSGPDSGTPCLKIFDRLLGTNAEPPISMPKERSFALGTVQGWMALFGYDVDPSPPFQKQERPNAKLLWYHHPSQPGHILVPSIMRVLAEARSDAEPFSKYLIEGDFGPDPGSTRRKVTWGGQTMSVLRWDPLDGIVIRIPDHPPVGEIQVEMAKDYEVFSNKVPISEWQVPFEYSVHGEGSLGASMNLQVKFRGDIHGSRGMPEMEPQYLPVVFSNMADCTGTISAGGTWVTSESSSLSWSGGSTLLSEDAGQGEWGVVDQRIFNQGALLVQGGSTLWFGLQASGRFTETERWRDSNGAVHEMVREQHLSLDAAPFLLGQPLSFIPSTGRLSSGNRSVWGDLETAVLSWPAVTPRFAPTEDTIR
ncbi:hypothetical protein HNR46_003775 [Haloferula luteola]|uniref:Caspase domain protein n=1 Tax=Haloferula luteola TaxID=595692 RepID=A0A840VDC9_9BACT|nr:hypothetical protein [Haloferula luteola]MBB5353514.1 hypothetical protein [Haloferula luteola]